MVRTGQRQCSFSGQCRDGSGDDAVQGREIPEMVGFALLNPLYPVLSPASLLRQLRLILGIQAEARLIRYASSSRDGYPTVNRQNLACDHARFVTGEIKRHVCDIAGLDQPEQMRVRKFRQRGISGN